MTCKIFRLLLFPLLLIASCQMAPPIASEWTYIGADEANLEETMKDCESRTNKDVYDEEDFGVFDVTDKATAINSVVLLPVIVNVKAEKYFNGCMNGRGFAKENDVDRLRKEVQEDIAARERYVNERKLAAKRTTIEVGDYVVAKFSILVIYKAKTTESDRVSSVGRSEKAKVLSIEEDWTKVELNDQIGWVRSGAIVLAL